jgi:glutaredoxin 3
MLEIYTRNGCPYCEKLKLILESFDVTFDSHNLDDNFTREEFYEKFGEGATFPQVLLDGSNMGGCAETIEYLVSIGCLQEEKDMECTV